MFKTLLTAMAALSLGNAALAEEKKADSMEEKNWSLVIHGGAGVIKRERITAEKDSEVRAALNRALEAGSKILAEGGTSMDAVEAAVIVLEDDPNFNAGRGSVFTYKGRNEMDAAFMDGETREAGAVAGSTTTKNPIKLARAVKDQSPHVLLSRDGANEFAVLRGLEQAGPQWFATDERYRQLEELKARQAGKDGDKVS
ncbi:MAG: isoaspartyl peptidase/L-asparaginase, partial [Pseudomonadota bacterium]